jgi:ABC-type multidrug transport system fused ATPase/permease subunit
MKGDITIQGLDKPEVQPLNMKLLPVTNTPSALLSKQDSVSINNEGINRSANTLFNITININKGSLVAIVGNVGSGKSSFLNTLLGEMSLQSGSVSMFGSVAYCEQRPWILNATVMNNILFGEPYDEKRFDDVLFACSLIDDIKVLPGGV